jgi:hypothetical protein
MLPSEHQRQIGPKIRTVIPLISVKLQFKEMFTIGLPQNIPRTCHGDCHCGAVKGRAKNPHPRYLPKPDRVL